MPLPKTELPKSLTKKLEKHSGFIKQIIAAKTSKQKIAVINLSSKSELLFLSQIVSDFKRKYLNGNLRECLSDKVVQELEQKSSEMSSFCDLNHKTLNKEDLFDSFTPIVESIPSILKQVQLMQKRSNKIKNQIENENSSVGTLQSQFLKKPVSPTFFPKKLQKRSDCPMCNNPNEKTECHNLKKTLKQLNNCNCEECTKLLSISRNGPKKELKQEKTR